MTALLDCRAAASLETSEPDTCALAVDYFGDVEHHDGFAPSLPRESHFRHSGWAAKRRRLYAALLRTGAGCRRCQHFAECGSSLWLLQDGATLELACNRCHDRLCDPCQKQRQAAVVEGIMLRMLDGDADCRFVTLTLKHQDAPLAVQLDRLIACFRLLRKHPDVGPRLQGGAWFIEVKLSKDKLLWHPHLHVIAAGKFIDYKVLSRAWYQVTGDSFITDIREIKDLRRRAQYVTKYSTKPLHNEVTLDPAKLDEFVVAIKGRRLYQCFGTWSKAVVRPQSARKDLQRLASMQTVWSNACAGEVQSLVLLHQAHAKWPNLRKSFPLPPWAAAPPPPTPPDGTHTPPPQPL